MSNGRRGKLGQRHRGTTLIELLVVIVIFLVGILAVVQIFPKGFQLLITTRNNTMAAKLGADEMERLNAHPDQLPEEILAVEYVNGTPFQDPTRDPNDLGPQGNAVNQSGILSLNGTPTGNWLLYSGPNSFRRIVGEGKRVPSPRPVGSDYGGLLVLNFAPIDPNGLLSVYANSYAKFPERPSNVQPVATQSVIVSGTPVTEGLVDTTDSLFPAQYFVYSPNNNEGGLPPTLYLPTNATYDRTYHMRISAYIGTVGGYTRRDFPDISFTVPHTTATDEGGNTPPLIQVAIADILEHTPGVIPPGQSLGSVEFSSVDVAPQFNQIQNSATFDNDPLEFKLLDPNLGVFLFSPAGYSATIEVPGGPREPLQARVNYDVYDWRIIRQDVRIDATQANNASYVQFPLALQSIKVGTQTGPDGLQNWGIAPFEKTAATPGIPSQNGGPDNFVLVDLQTGATVYETDPNTGAPLVTVDKHNGIVTVQSSNTGATGIQGYLAIPGTTGPTSVNLTGRSLRALYLGRQEWSVRVLKSASSYSITGTHPPAQGQVYVPTVGNPGTRIYFPKSDNGQKVTVDEIYYIGQDRNVHEIDGQDFVIAYPTVGNTLGLPCIDIRNVDPNANFLAINYGAVARGIKGASLVVQVLWNPGAFSLTPNSATNMNSINTWGRGWRRATTQTFLESEGIQ